MRINPANARHEMVQVYRTKFLGPVNHRAETALKEWLRETLRLSITLTPKDTGALRESGRFETEQHDLGPRGHISFGGANYRVNPTPNAPSGYVDYAIDVHESPPRKWRITGTGEGFLRKAVQQSRRKIRSILVKHLKKVAG